jgi:flagellar biosynthesis protein FlhG
MANVHIFSGINPSHTLLDVVERRAALDEILLPGPAGIQVMCGASGVSRLADISAPVIEALGRELMRVASGFDVLVMDTGAGVANSVMHFLGMAQDVIVVATPNLAATLDAYGIIKLAREYRIAGRMNLLINMADSEEQAARVAERVVGCARRFLDHAPASLGHLVRDQAVEHANQSRRPLVIAHPEHFNARRFGELAAKLMGATTDEHIEPQPIDQQIAAA